MNETPDERNGPVLQPAAGMGCKTKEERRSLPSLSRLVQKTKCRTKNPVKMSRQFNRSMPPQPPEGVRFTVPRKLEAVVALTACSHGLCLHCNSWCRVGHISQCKRAGAYVRELLQPSLQKAEQEGTLDQWSPPPLPMDGPMELTHGQVKRILQSQSLGFIDGPGGTLDLLGAVAASQKGPPLEYILGGTLFRRVYMVPGYETGSLVPYNSNQVGLGWRRLAGCNPRMLSASAWCWRLTPNGVVDSSPSVLGIGKVRT
jgi:hypothetical protein